MKHKKIKIILIAILIIALIGFGFYLGKRFYNSPKENSVESQNLLIAQQLKKDYSVNSCNVTAVSASISNDNFLVNLACVATEKEIKDYCGELKNECYGADTITEEIIVDKELNQIFSSGRKNLSYHPDGQKIQGFVNKNLLGN